MESNTAPAEPVAASNLPPADPTPAGAAAAAPQRLHFVDALRAAVAQMVVWHHFALYGPLSDWAIPRTEWLLDWMRNYRWAVQVFFIISGYLFERSLAPRTWNLSRVGWFLLRRYCRLGLPYLAAIAMAVAASAYGRGWLPDTVVGAPPTLAQVAAHVVFLQDILGYESLSAGLWFVCIEFQLGIVYIALLWARDLLGGTSTRWRGLPLFVGWALALASLFYFNVHERFDVWATYFFAHFFLGVMVYRALERRRDVPMFWLYVLAEFAALAYDWRWRLVTALAAGLLLYAAGRLRLIARWPKNRVIAYLGRTSYSLFLVHFPVLVVVTTMCLQLGGTSQRAAEVALAAAYLASLATADAFYRAVERPTARLSKRIS